jgi:hypothetical protein
MGKLVVRELGGFEKVGLLVWSGWGLGKVGMDEKDGGV